MQFNGFKLIITCEHACNALPTFAKSLNIPEEVLESHRGYDIAAIDVYKHLVKQFKPDYYSAGKYSRLFIDLNRSLWNKSVLSEFWENAKPEDGPLEKLARDSAKYFALRKKAFAYYLDYHTAIESFVEQNISDAPIVHLAIHSFTPVLNGKERDADIGILYDPSRVAEKAYADVIVDTICRNYPQYKIRRNYPYQGKTDGLCTALRQKFDPQKTGCYVGFEIEINQKLL